MDVLGRNRVASEVSHPAEEAPVNFCQTLLDEARNNARCQVQKHWDLSKRCPHCGDKFVLVPVCCTYKKEIDQYMGPPIYKVKRCDDCHLTTACNCKDKLRVLVELESTLQTCLPEETYMIDIGNIVAFGSTTPLTNILNETVVKGHEGIVEAAIDANTLQVRFPHVTGLVNCQRCQLLKKEQGPYADQTTLDTHPESICTVLKFLEKQAEQGQIRWGFYTDADRVEVAPRLQNMFTDCGWKIDTYNFFSCNLKKIQLKHITTGQETLVDWVNKGDCMNIRREKQRCSVLCSTSSLTHCRDSFPPELDACPPLPHGLAWEG